MIEEFFKNLDISQLFNILAGVIAFFVAYLKILPLIPRSSTKILSDIEVYDKAKNSNFENLEEIKIAIEREIYRKYRKPTRIYNYTQFVISLIFLVCISYLIYSRVIKNEIDTTFYFLILIDFLSLVFLMNSFDEPLKKKDSEKEIDREPVFKFEIFSWSELFSGIVVTTIFGFWTYSRLFKTGRFEFDWWSLLTFMFCFTGIGILTGAFKKKK